MNNLNKIKITTEDDNSDETPTLSPVTQKYVNRQDLADKCSTLTEDDDHDTTHDFINNFDTWFKASHLDTGDLRKKKIELWSRCTRHLKTDLQFEFNYQDDSYDKLKSKILARI